MSGTVIPGGTKRWPANTELLGAPGTPTVLTLTVKDPSGATVAGFPIALGGLGTSGTGQYYYDWVTNVLTPTGIYTATWAGTLNGLPISATDTVGVGGPAYLLYPPSGPILTGDIMRVWHDFANDPTTVKLRWRVAGGTETIWVYLTDTQIIKDSTGVYHADIPIVMRGLHYFRWVGTGTVAAASEGTFSVTGSFVGAP